MWSCSFSQTQLFDPGGNWPKKDDPCPFHLLPIDWCDFTFLLLIMFKHSFLESLVYRVEHVYFNCTSGNH